jgi:hypothetical protein
MGKNAMTAADIAAHTMVTLSNKGYVEIGDLSGVITDMEVVIQSVIHAPPAKIADAVIQELFDNADVLEVYAEDADIIPIVVKFASRMKQGAS